MEYGLVVIWLLMLVALGAAGLPLAALIFRDLADRGAAFAIPLSLATLGIVAYVVGQVTFGPLALAAGVLVLVGSSVALSTRVTLDYREYVTPAVVFSAAFLLIVLIRGADPAISPGAGEKFLDFGLLQSILRAEVLPPEDMWFAGEPVQYYYGGQLIAGLLTMLTGTGPAFAYNLALAAFFGAFVVAGYGVAANVAATHGISRNTAGLLGAFFVAVAANLDTAARLGLWLLPDGVATSLVTGLGLSEDLAAWTPADFHYWDASRIIPGGINEFPLFAWLNGDLHAHMMSPPYLLLVVGVCLAYWVTPENERRRRQLLLLGVVPPIAGLLTVINTWSMPSAVALVGLTALFAPTHPATLLPERVRWAEGGDLRERYYVVRAHARRIAFTAPIVIAVLLLGVVWSLPFLLTSASSQPIEIFLRESPMGALLLVHGGFLLGFVPYLALRAGSLLSTPWPVAGGVIVASLVLWILGFASVALMGPILAVAWILLTMEGDVGMETVLILGGVGLVLIVEFVNVDTTPNLPQQVGEWNTLFKAYAQVWALWAPAAGVVFARLLSTNRSAAAAAVDRPDWWPTLGAILTTFVLVTTAMYAGFALPSHFSGGVDTLDGTAYVDDFHPDEAPAIEWIDDLEGQPNIASAPACACNELDTYSWVSAPSSLTGVPTLAGWGAYGGHEYIYRSQEAFDARVDDVATIYTGNSSERRPLLDQYDVEYVYVGPIERDHYEEITITEGSTFTVAFENEAVTIYAVS